MLKGSVYLLLEHEHTSGIDGITLTVRSGTRGVGIFYRKLCLLKP